MDKIHDIYKASGIILKDRKVLVGRSTGKEYFIHPGGKIEPGETAKQAVIRELKEEFQIDVLEEDLEEFDKNSAPAANSPEIDVHMEVFLVKKWQGDIIPDNEIEENRWLTSDVPKDIKIGSIMEHETIPKLKFQNLID
ncbi:MAG TPA: NUDIX domain-containing protein [Patescibacteria group bacterium]|jgi:8-oxo-dGTP diphosphatase|nr:NUDIX domain-containing protein [Patescibacteria group bacterium]